MTSFFEQLAAICANSDWDDLAAIARARQAWDDGAKGDYYNAPMIRREDRDEQERLAAPLEAAFQAAFDLSHEIERR